MLGKIKYWLRQLKAEGKFTTSINLLVQANAHIKSIKQRTRRGQAERSLERWCKQGHSVEGWVDFIWTAADGFFRPIQQRQEVTELIELVSVRKPDTVLEIGTANGGSLFLFCQAAASEATIVSIDLPGGINGGGFPHWKTELYKQFAGAAQRLTLLRMNSHKLSTFDMVKRLSSSGKFDVIMIDADHSYEGVKRDFDRFRLIGSGMR